MSKNNDLTSGHITKKIILLAIPLLLTSFLEMAYSFIDMIWIAQISSDAVAAVGTAGFFPWFGFTITQYITVGTQTRSGQEIGDKNFEKAKQYQKTGMQLAAVIGIIYAFITFVFAENLIGIFNIDNHIVNEQSINYLKVLSLFMPILFINITFTRIYNSKGMSKTPFIFNLVGSVTNIILDPILIFGWFGLKPMGVVGAALATVIGHSIVTICFLVYTLKKSDFLKFDLLKIFNKKIAKEILTLSFMPGAQSMFFCVTAMIVGVIVAKFGSDAIGVQKVGGQLESISWNTATSLSIAIGAFTSQNFGANKLERIKKGYNSILIVSVCIGAFATVIFSLFPHIILIPFYKEAHLIQLGANYLKIIAISLIPQTVEIMTIGSFNGLGITKPASIVSIVFNVLRIFTAIILSNIIGLNGVWWAITTTTLLKGIIIFVMYRRYEAKLGIKMK